MTEQTLKKAIEVKRQIDHLRERKAGIEKLQAWFKEENIIFRIQAQVGACCGDSVIISEATAKQALDNEFENIKKEIEVLLIKLFNLH